MLKLIKRCLLAGAFVAPFAVVLSAQAEEELPPICGGPKACPIGWTPVPDITKGDRCSYKCEYVGPESTELDCELSDGTDPACGCDESTQRSTSPWNPQPEFEVCSPLGF